MKSKFVHEKTAIIVFGLPAAGKTLFAHSLAGMNDSFIHYSTDVFRRKLKIRKEDMYFTDTLNIYTDLIKRSIIDIENDMIPIIDATFYHKDLRNLLTYYEHDSIFTLGVLLKIPPKITLERIKKRRGFGDIYQGVADIETYYRLEAEFSDFIPSNKSEFDCIIGLNESWELKSLYGKLIQNEITDFIQKTIVFLRNQ